MSRTESTCSNSNPPNPPHPSNGRYMRRATGETPVVPEVGFWSFGSGRRAKSPRFGYTISSARVVWANTASGPGRLRCVRMRIADEQEIGQLWFRARRLHAHQPPRFGIVATFVTAHSPSATAFTRANRAAQSSAPTRAANIPPAIRSASVAKRPDDHPFRFLNILRHPIL